MFVRAFLFAIALAAISSTTLAQVPGIVTREADLIGSKGEAIGTVVVRGSANATVIRITVAPGGLAPGWHGVRLHATGDCSDVDQFLRARGPINHLVKSHGLLHPEGPQEGDLPNISAHQDGSTNAEVSSHAVRMLGNTGLIEGDGSALIVYSQEDDHTSEPVGNAGHRIACAVLK
jgi:superoxide dismutase, Cu-Zn family